MDANHEGGYSYRLCKIPDGKMLSILVKYFMHIGMVEILMGSNNIQCIESPNLFLQSSPISLIYFEDLAAKPVAGLMLISSFQSGRHCLGEP